MTQTPNQFNQTPQKGDVDLITSTGATLTVRLASGSATVVPGEAVKIVDSTSKVPEVTALTADTDSSFGFVLRNFKDEDREAGENLEIGIAGQVVYLEAGAAIARGAGVEVDASTKKVITSAGTNPIVGTALDKVAADGDLIRVLIATPIVVQP